MKKLSDIFFQMQAAELFNSAAVKIDRPNPDKVRYKNLSDQFRVRSRRRPAPERGKKKPDLSPRYQNVSEVANAKLSYAF